MPMPAPTNQGWVYDFIFHYRLDEDIIGQYLKESFGDYDFQIVVSRQFNTILLPDLLILP